MTGKELWAQYQHYTRDVTEHARKLAFAGVAICWFFRSPEVQFPDLVLWSLASFVLFFVFDVLHPLAGAAAIRLFTERAEKNLWEATQSIEGEIEKSRWIDYPATSLFLAKIAFLLAGFAFLLAEFWIRA